MTHTEYMKIWRKNPNSYFRCIYTELKRRCKGHGKKYYIGLPFMDKKEWQLFLSKTEIIRAKLYDAYKGSGWQRKSAPSIDRIDSAKGYIFDNCQWLTVSQNAFKRWEDGRYWKR